MDRDPDVPEREVRLEDVLKMAQGLQRQEKLDEAEAIYLQILSQLPGEPNTLNFLGVLRHQQGRNRDALNYISQALEQMPEEPGPWTNLANVLIEIGEYDEALAALRRVSELEPSSPRPYNNLGVMLLRSGDFAGAEAAFQAALERSPGLSYLHYNLAGLYLRTERMNEAAVHGLRSLELDKGNRRARKLLSRVLELEGKHEAAVQNLREWAEMTPDDPEARHYLAAFGAAEVPVRASDAYVKQVFDRFADSFEVQLEKLGYDAPRHVCEAYARHRGHLDASAVVLDAGCGTGLCAPLLRPLAGRLEGVDLSAGMLRRAALRQLYDALHEAELTAYLAEQPMRFDAIVSADVLNYFGDLEPVLRVAAGALRPGGVLTFSVEAAAADVPGYALAVHGRYSHARGFVEALLARVGLALLEVETQVLRKELLQPVQGLIFSARK